MNKILWSPRAANDLVSIIDYIQNKWDTRSAVRFLNWLEQVLGLIRDNPNLFIASDKLKDVRRCVLRRQISLYHRLRNQK